MTRIEVIRKLIAERLREINDMVLVAKGEDIQNLQDAANHLVQADIHLEKMCRE